MSIQSISSTISRLNKELSDITHRMSLEQTKASSVTAKIIQLQTSITKTTTASTLKTKLSEISRKEQENAQIQKKLSDLQKKKTDIQNKLLKENQNLAKAEALERKKLDALAKKQQKEEIEHQKKLKREIESIKASTQHITGATASPYLDVTPEPEYDLFISHASEDKDDFVREFATSLTNKGLKVWYDEFALKIGDSLRQKIDRGLAKSRVGLVVLSPSFIAKGWTNYELDGIVTRNVSGEQILLPIWHNLTKQQVIDFSPSLADKVARSTATHTVDEISNEIVDLINSHK